MTIPRSLGHPSDNAEIAGKLVGRQFGLLGHRQAPLSLSPAVGQTMRWPDITLAPVTRSSLLNVHNLHLFDE
ncbi:MAG: hypothetical protein FWD12_05525 [Alphaproteobacteria bacterium]|nr:hypothetical protein [Alphaproteobacteria bacterium]